MRVRAEQDELRRRRAASIGLVRRARVLLEGDVEVAAAEAEGADGGATRMIRVANPGSSARAQIERALFQIELGVRRVDLDARREDLVVQREHGLHHARGAGGGLGVTDLRLHGADGAPLLGVGVGFAEDRLHALELGCVARDGAGAVGLDQLHRLGAELRLRVGAAHGLGLTRRHGRVHALGASVAAATETADHAVHAITVALGVFEALEREHAEAFAEHGAVRVVAEGSAVARLAQRGRLAEAHVHEDVVHGVGAAADADVRVAHLQLRDGHGERGQAAGAGGVRDAVLAAEVEAVGDAPRDDVAQDAGEGALLPRRVVALDARAGFLHLTLGHAHVAQGLGPHRALQAADHGAEQLLRAGHAEHHAHALPVFVLELTLGRVVEHALRHDQRQQLAGVRGGHDVGRDAPGHRIEVHLGQERAAVGVGLVGRFRVGVVVVLRQPVAGRHGAHQIVAFDDVPPEAGRIDRAGEERADADDGDGAVLANGHVGLLEFSSADQIPCLARRAGADGNERPCWARGRHRSGADGRAWRRRRLRAGSARSARRCALRAAPGTSP